VSGGPDNRIDDLVVIENHQIIAAFPRASGIEQQVIMRTEMSFGRRSPQDVDDLLPGHAGRDGCLSD
jgi:hypothetical protein